MKRFLSIFILLFSTSFAQEVTIPSLNFPDSTYRVGNIVCIGNVLTEYYIIESEMAMKMDSLITHQSVQYDINRIYGLRLFTKVTIDVVPDSREKATLIIRVNERWFFYPFPVLGVKDRDFTKIYYGAGVIHNNVSGQNVQMYGSFAFGYDPYISVGYFNPLIDIKSGIFVSIRAYSTEQRNRSLVSLAGLPNFDEIRSGGSVGGGKRFTLFSTFSMSVEYLNLKVTDNKAGRTMSPSGRDEFLSLHASYAYDSRDLREYPSDGSLVSFGVSKHGLFEQDVDYQRYSLDLRRYVPVTRDLIIAGRAFTSIASGGSVPNYGHMFFGYLERVRGHFKTVREGEQIFGSTLEVHYPLISPRYIRFDFIPFEQFRDVRYAVYLAGFADAGNTWYRKEPLALNTFSSGYGLGIHVHLAYSTVARIEFGIPYGRAVTKGEIILDLGAAL